MSGFPALTKNLMPRTIVILLVFLLGINAFGINLPKASAYAGPDLIVQDIISSPIVPSLDDEVTITATLRNQGDTSASASEVACYIDNVFLQTQSASALNAGVSTTVSFTWQATRGTHIIKVVADSAGTIAETDETNNTNTYTLTTLAPDLIIQSITWSPTNPSAGDSIIFSITIKNQGNTKSRNTNINFYIDGNTRGIQDINAINPSASLTKNYSWTALSGQHTLQAVVDETNNNKESDETNNELIVTFATGVADLAFQDVTWSPQDPSKYDTVTCNITVINYGQARAEAWYLAHFLDGTLKSTILGSSLESGASENITLSWQTIQDTHDLRIVLDYYNTVIETDETNNEYTVSITTLVPDLIVSDVSWLPVNPGAGDDVKFTVKIKNQGSGRAASSRAASYIDNHFISYLNIPEIDAGTQETATFNWPATSGTHVIEIIADYDKLLNEINTDNNNIYVNITIAPPDLIISSISWSPENATIDEIVTFTANITNQGGGRALNFYIAYLIDDVLLSSELISRLDARASVNATCGWKMTNGRHTFRAIANYNNYIAESDKTNNENSILFAPRLPDLAITSIIWSPPEIPTGETIIFTINVENQGLSNAAPSRIAFYIDAAIAGYADIEGLETGATTIEYFSWVASEGAHNIRVILDSLNQIVEIDEDNNIKGINIPLPDLTIEGITFSPSDAQIGDTLIITAYAKNQGGSETEITEIDCYVDGIKIASQELPSIDAGESATKVFNWVAEAGTHTFRVTIDAANTVIEVNETNNEKENDCTVATPDLIVEDMSWTTSNQANNNEATFTITIKNIGAGAAGESHVKYSFDSSPADIKNLASIPAGETAVFSFITILSSGQHIATIIADYDNVITELDEDNNQSVIPFSTLTPDLIIRTITYSPLDAGIGDNITIAVKLENRGTSKASDMQLTLFIDGFLVDYAEIAEMEIGIPVTIAFGWTAIEGEHEIAVFADSEQTILENNELNNSKSRTIMFEKTSGSVKAAVNINTDSDDGFMGSYWWLMLLVTGLLGAAAFIPTLRSLKKR